MLYFMANCDAFDFENKITIISGELLTTHERNTKARSIPDHAFNIVAINKNDTFTNFGVRFPKHGAFIKKAFPDGSVSTEKYERSV